MYTPSPREVAIAFDLGEPAGELVHFRRGGADTWRLNTSTGSYFVKGYFPTIGSQLIDGLAVAMAFERDARAARIDMPGPVMPIDPLLDWLTRIEDRVFRVYRWIEHRTYDRDVSVWLGRTMTQVHQLQPIGAVGLPEWWRPAIQSPEIWAGWFAMARDRDVPWAGLCADCLPHILAATERITELLDVAPDIVTTHGDFKTHNIVMSESGPVLVDWDSVRTDSAALEAGRVAYIFGAGDPEQINKILTAYAEAGGELGWAGPDLFLGVTRNHLQILAEQIRVSLGEATAASWMGEPATIDAAIADLLRGVPGKLDQLRQLTSNLDLA
ncbi:phosphotransferase family enzyme [Kribbella rubisoli]|uniref:Phosphotransferase family enzyme n=1 Tax=Kribbella rubisoli TaxID=3075929 RepID=A0A4Q7WV14_9ACTN|nr:aminoglycoside phosphotransferase family protein [Kribbella rubisoli]RZU13888.1 phosphotransferase family enzyme [Kribbella rubisoli]